MTFSADEVSLYQGLKISQPFSKFVHDAFYDKIDVVKRQSEVDKS